MSIIHNTFEFIDLPEITLDVDKDTSRDKNLAKMIIDCKDMKISTRDVYKDCVVFRDTRRRIKLTIFDSDYNSCFSYYNTFDRYKIIVVHCRSIYGFATTPNAIILLPRVSLNFNYS